VILKVGWYEMITLCSPGALREKTAKEKINSTIDTLPIAVRLCINLICSSTPRSQKIVTFEERPSPEAVFSSVSSQTMTPICADRASSPIQNTTTSGELEK